MSIADNKTDVIYPESDGRPVGETELHIDWIFRLRDILKTRYKNQEVYVGADMLVYYNEGVPYDYFVPDIFVVKPCPTHRRRVYKIWEEPSPPSVIVEVTSKSTRRNDEVLKPRVYADIGVKEYFAFDPTADYLDPALQGFRMTETGYESIKATKNGVLHCETLGIHFSLDELDLKLRDATSGKELLTAFELEEQRRIAELAASEERRAAELAASEERRAAELAASEERRVAELAASEELRREEVARLEAEIKRLRGQS